MNILTMIPASRRRSFDPLTLTPALWLDASDDATLFDSTSGGSLPTDGNDIARWEDRSGNARHFTQGTAASCPHRQTGVQNGLPVARFDGLNDVMNMVSGLEILREKSGASVVAVYRWISNDTTANRNVLSVSTVTAGASRITMRANIVTARKLDFGGRRLDADSFASVQSAQNEPSSCFVHSGVCSYQNRTLRQYINNSIDGTSDVFQTSGNTSATDSLSVSIGGLSSLLNAANIDLSELFVFDRAISDDDRNALHAYLVAKWGI
jgi:hypothetical protein